MVNVEFSSSNNKQVSKQQVIKLLTELTDNVGLHLKSVSINNNKIVAKFGNASIDVLANQINKKLDTDYSNELSVKGLFSQLNSSSLKLSYLEIERKKVEV